MRKWLKSLGNCKSIEEKIKYINLADPVELAGEVMGMEAIIIAQEKCIELLKKKIKQKTIDGSRSFFVRTYNN